MGKRSGHLLLPIYTNCLIILIRIYLALHFSVKLISAPLANGYTLPNGHYCSETDKFVRYLFL